MLIGTAPLPGQRVRVGTGAAAPARTGSGSGMQEDAGADVRALVTKCRAKFGRGVLEVGEPLSNRLIVDAMRQPRDELATEKASAPRM